MDAAALVEWIARSELQAEIAQIADFEVARPEAVGGGPPDPAIIIAHAPGHALFGEDGAGGSYHLLADGRVLLIDSEGSAGVVAADFSQFIATTTGLSSWRDALGMMGEADPEAAEAAYRQFEAQWGLDAALDQPWEYGEGYLTPTPRAGRDAVLAYFEVSPLDDPFGALHHAIHSLNDDVRVTAEDGWVYLRFGQVPDLD